MPASMLMHMPKGLAKQPAQACQRPAQKLLRSRVAPVARASAQDGQHRAVSSQQAPKWIAPSWLKTGLMAGACLLVGLSNSGPAYAAKKEKEAKYTVPVATVLLKLSGNTPSALGAAAKVAPAVAKEGLGRSGGSPSRAADPIVMTAAVVVGAAKQMRGFGAFVSDGLVPAMGALMKTSGGSGSSKDNKPAGSQ
eukprot:XP_001699530.1 predicted protein [Chlamydomonas reinhardtii]